MEAVFTRWEELVGAELGEHLQPGAGATAALLVVAVDHPAWATRARMESGQILSPAARSSGDTPDRRASRWSSNAP